MTGARGFLRRLAAVAGVAAGLFAALALLAAPAASAHPLGNFTINRYSDLDLAPGAVTVTYVLDMAEIPTAQRMPQIDTNGDGTATAQERQAWADLTAPALLSHVRLDVGGAPVSLSLARDVMTFRPGQAGLPIIRLVATFTGDLPGAAGSVVYRDANFGGRIGWKEITVHSADGVSIAGSSVPARSISHGLLAYPKDLLQSPLDVTQAMFSFHPGPGTAGGNAPSAGATVSGAPVASGGSFAGLVTWRLTPMILVLSLGLAFVFGAVHALGPGHGKTITAAYLVGAEARARQAVVVGVVIALMHTASVLALGLVALVLFKDFASDTVYPWLGLITGLVALGLGGALFLIRLRARRRGEDPWGSHGHDHPWDHAHLADVPIPGEVQVRELALAQVGAGPTEVHTTMRAGGLAGDGHTGHGTHDHAHQPHAHIGENGHAHPHGGDGPPPRSSMSRPGLMALAISGGILPSPTALVVLTAAGSYHRVGYGLGLILAFSVGLATALTVVGLLALRTRSLVSRRFSGRWAALLPLVSAAVIVGVGLFFTVRGAAQIL